MVKSQQELKTKRLQDLLAKNDQTAFESYKHYLDPEKRLNAKESGRRYYFAKKLEEKLEASKPKEAQTELVESDEDKMKRIRE